MFWFFAIFFFIFLLPLVLGIAVPVYKNHYKATGNIINHNSNMKKFVYKVNLSSKDIISILETKSDIDELSCTFDFKKSVITFEEYGSHREYYFQIQEFDGFAVLKLEQVASVAMQSHIPYKLNPFIISKLQAEIIPFSQYSF